VAFEKTRAVQQILFKVQTSLRRMPGVSASESDAIAASLKEVAQLVSQETSQLVDAIMNLTLDGEETDKAIARMSIEASLAKAAFEDKMQRIRDLERKLAEEREAREKAGNEVKKMMEELQELSAEFKDFKDNSLRNSGSPDSQKEEIIKVCFPGRRS
jgi:chromosome segregation ATPase